MLHEVVKKHPENAKTKLAASITVTEASVVEELRKKLEKMGAKMDAEEKVETLGKRKWEKLWR